MICHNNKKKLSVVFFFYHCFHFTYIFTSLSQRRKGVEGLIEIENPNRVAQKNKKVADIELEGPKQLSRRER